MMTKFLFFALLGLIILFGSHLLLYYSSIHFFRIVSPKSQGILLSILAFLSVSFFLASLLAHYQENIFSISLYALAGFRPGKPTVLLHHAPIDIEAAKRSGVNLQLSGHTHKGQIFPFNLITRWIYKGYDYGLKTEGNYSIYTSNGVGTWGPPMRTFNTPEIVVITLR